MGGNFSENLKDTFSTISLSKLNADASFLDRIDTKFLLTEQQFISLIPEFQKDFYILEIWGKTLFQYDSVYMDTKDYDSYYDHQNDKKSRSKIRTREYEDSGVAYFEYKQKQGKNLRKFRYPIDLRDHGKMTSESEKFYEGLSMSFEWHEKPKKISPTLRTEYHRLTLCSKDSSERITVDFEIKLTSLKWKEKTQKLHNTVIMESKTSDGKWICNKILEKYNIKQIESCSKYCLWLLLNGVFKKEKKFKEAIKKIKWMS